MIYKYELFKKKNYLHRFLPVYICLKRGGEVEFEFVCGESTVSDFQSRQLVMDSALKSSLQSSNTSKNNFASNPSPIREFSDFLVIQHPNKSLNPWHRLELKCTQENDLQLSQTAESVYYSLSVKHHPKVSCSNIQHSSGFLKSDFFSCKLFNSNY